MNRILPPTYLWAYLILAVVLHFLFPGKQIIFFPYNLLGILFLITGTVMNVWADSVFKKVKTTIKPGGRSTVLVVQGPYRFSRHPMYLGMALFLIGVSILLGSLVPFIPPLLFIIAMEVMFIPQEEKVMEKTFPEEYPEYKKKARRWL